jgi:hypothetical protein
VAMRTWLRMSGWDVGVRQRRLQKGKGMSEWRKWEEAESRDRGARRASWRYSWVLPEGDLPAISVIEVAGRLPERRRSRTRQLREPCSISPQRAIQSVQGCARG